MTTPSPEGSPVDAIDMIRQLELMVSGLIHDLAISRARIDRLEAEAAERDREDRVRAATSSS